MEYRVYARGKDVGLCRFYDEGLYWRLDCSCRQEQDVPMRLFGGGTALGIPERTGEQWRLRRRLSKASMPRVPGPEGRVLLLPARQQTVSVLGYELTGYREVVENSTVLRLDFFSDRPHPCMPLFCFFHLQDGFWQITLDEEGKPVF